MPSGLEKSAGDGWTTLTELADTLVRDHELPFKSAHAIASRLVAGRRRSPDKSLSALLGEATADILDARLALQQRRSRADSEPASFRQHQKNVWRSGVEETTRAAEASHLHLESDRAWWTGRMTALTDAEQRLAERAQAL
jgi:argininosuccinate lyase